MVKGNTKYLYIETLKYLKVKYSMVYHTQNTKHIQNLFNFALITKLCTLYSIKKKQQVFVID